MISDSRKHAEGRPPTIPAGTRPTAGSDYHDVSDSVLVELVSRRTVAAFVALFERTAEAALAELTVGPLGGSRAGEILAASYVEVWWLAGSHCAPDADVSSWIIGIVRRRVAEACREPSQRGEHQALAGPRPSYAELEFAALFRWSVDHPGTSR